MDTGHNSVFISGILFAISAFLLLFTRSLKAKEDDDTKPERPLSVVVRQRNYVVAAVSSGVAFGVMGFIMSATPLSMNVMDHFSLSDTTLVIQSHVIAMYLPSLFTGFLVERLGVRALQVTGVVGMGAGMAVAVSGHHMVNYLTGLVLLGLGWNFLFVAGTVMLTRSYYPRERFKAQGVNDFAIFAFQAAAVLLAGSVLSAANWEILNLLGLPFLVFTLVLVLTTRSKAPSR